VSLSLFIASAVPFGNRGRGFDFQGIQVSFLVHGEK